MIKAVLFDFDGTLTCPGALDFPKIKNSLGCPSEIPVLEYLESLKDSEQKQKIQSGLETFEMEAAAVSKPNAGAENLIKFLRAEGILTGILTRNSLSSVKRSLDNFDLIGFSDFDVVITRESPAAFKPSPEGVLLAAEKLGVKPDEMLVVGDFIFDIIAANNGGSISVLITNNDETDISCDDSDYQITRLNELKNILNLFKPLPPGKFPNELLRIYLDEFSFDDPSVIIRPGIGEDIAAVDMTGEEVLVLKSDPITFATDAISHYAVLVNANDIATSGAVPRWFLTTLLFPCGVNAAEILRVLRDLKAVCRQWGITLCGGHTEITDAVTRPVISGMLAGTVRRAGLIDKKQIRTGHRLLLTKGLAVEGSSIIAREFGKKLENLGMDAKKIETCRQFISQISVLDEARIAAECQGTSAMHDVTEGGLSTALEELSIVSGHKIRVLMENIPVFPQTQVMCELLGLNPLGLIASGSMLICCREEFCKMLIAQIFKAGIRATYIGEICEPGGGIEALYEGQFVEWPRFDTDEITKLF